MSQQGLNEKFLAFCSYGTRAPEAQLDGAKFTKLARDSGLIDKQLSQTDVELIFAKVPPAFEAFKYLATLYTATRRFRL